MINAVGRLPVVFLMGPTASGKTDVAAELSESFPVDLISVDAAQVYQRMDIGTAKPDTPFLEKYPHQLIDIRHPLKTYSAADFVADANAAISRSHRNSRIPLLVGGTLFYFNALEHGLSDLPAANSELRLQIEGEIEQYGVAEMHRTLALIDPTYSRRIDPNDRQRVQRAMEIYRTTGKAPSQVMTKRKKLDCPLIKITLFTADRKSLHGRIATRFEEMLEQGLVEEVQGLIEDTPELLSAPSMRTVGYRQVIPYLKDEISYNEMVESGVAATRQLAKRQLTWLRQQSGLTWVEKGIGSAAPAIESYLKHHPWTHSMAAEGVGRSQSDR